jgi:hypothetical protein
MTEQRATDWKGPVALVLAGLALLVALSGRGFPFDRHFDGPRNMNLWAEAAPVPAPTAVPAQPMPPGGLYGMNEPVPMAPVDPSMRERMLDKWYRLWGEGEMEGAPFHMAKPEPPMPAPGGYYFDGGSNALDGIWGYVRGAYHYFQPLLQLALLVLLGVILFTWLRRRARPAYPAGYYPGYPGYNQGYPAPPPPSAPPAQGQGNDTPPAGYPGPGVLD